ncbi:MAG: hypothetical protein ACP5JG_07390 [Anaerolineae bacterium]
MAKDDIVRRDIKDELGVLLTPLSLRGIPVWAVYVLALLSLIYILNPTAGVLEVLPDNLPFIGNLDEGVAFALLWYGLVEFFEGPKFRS